jgi:hypothetical protein
MRRNNRIEYLVSRTNYRWGPRLGLSLLLCVAVGTFVFNNVSSQCLFAQEEYGSPLELDNPTSESDPDAAQELDLTEKQRLLSQQYALLEEALARMAESVQGSDPHRAELLRNAAQESQTRAISFQFSDMVELLTGKLYSKASDNQDQLEADLLALLELLESENRAERLEEERAEIEKLLDDIDGVIRDQRKIQSKTLGGESSGSLADEQAELADETKGLADRAEAQAGNEQEGTEGSEPSEGSTPDSPPQEQEPGTPSSGEGEGGESSSGGGSASQSGGPASERLSAAQRAMEAAEEKLRQAERDGAIADQEEAIRELEQARAELEEILRQMREEEIARMLELLDARLNRMLSMQIIVNESTIDLYKNANETLTPRDLAIESARLSEQEREIIIEADEALALLREEGSAIAFPEAIEQTRSDMLEIVKLLDNADVGLTTQTIEQDIADALKELLKSLEQAKEEAESRSQESSESQEQEPALIELIAELQLIRSMQVRVNERTEFYASLLEKDPSQEPTIRIAVRELADKEQKLYDILREIERAQNAQ